MCQQLIPQHLKIGSHPHLPSSPAPLHSPLRGCSLVHPKQHVIVDALSEVLPLPGPEAGMRKPASQRTRVLLIEDNPGDARLIEFMISDAGQDVFSFERVERLSEGLEHVCRGGIGVVLLDLSLPDSHGLDTFFQLREAAPGIPIIVLSGLNDTSVAVEAVHEGAQDFLIKGQVDGQLLVRAMRYAIERKRMAEQLGRYAEELRSKNAQLEADFNMAREIQEVFLPRQYPTFPRQASSSESALQFAHRYIPAAAVGGDFFDVLALSDTQAGVFICDVMGHGMRAALITAIMRGLIEELLSSAYDPGGFPSRNQSQSPGDPQANPGAVSCHSGLCGGGRSERRTAIRERRPSQSDSSAPITRPG